jgi:hypothetical protein
VVKNDSVRGGSARPEFVKKHHSAHRKICFCIPSPISFCCDEDETIPNMKGTFIVVPQVTDSTRKHHELNVSSLSSSDFSNVGPPNSISTTTTSNASDSQHHHDENDNDNNNNNNNNPKVFHTQKSSRIVSYGTKKVTHYALKSIILDRCSTPEFKEELKNEGSLCDNSFST